MKDGFVCIYSGGVFKRTEGVRELDFFEETIPIVYPLGMEGFREKLFERAHLHWLALIDKRAKKEPLAFDYEAFEFAGRSWWTEELIDKDGKRKNDTIQLMTVHDWFLTEGIIKEEQIAEEEY